MPTVIDYNNRMKLLCERISGTYEDCYLAAFYSNASKGFKRRIEATKIADAGNKISIINESRYMDLFRFTIQREHRLRRNLNK